MMAIKELEAAIESILFALGESVELERIAGAVDHDEETVRNVLRNMMTRYDEEDRGIHIIEMEGAFQLCTKPEMYEYLIKVAHIPKKHVLTDVLLETLSIVAYKQPITRIEIEKIRGVSCDHAVSKLVEYGLVQEVGRMDAPGRPMMFGTTEEFLRYFNYESLDDLPILNQETIEDFKAEVEQELGFELSPKSEDSDFDDLFGIGDGFSGEVVEKEPSEEDVLIEGQIALDGGDDTTDTEAAEDTGSAEDVASDEDVASEEPAVSDND